ncbi:hypothetical protein Tco_0871266, partial [Tanacetum coccineum]
MATTARDGTTQATGYFYECAGFHNSFHPFICVFPLHSLSINSAVINMKKGKGLGLSNFEAVQEAKDGSKGSLEWAKKKAKAETHPLSTTCNSWKSCKAYNLIKEVLEKNQKQCVRESTSVPCCVEGSHVAANVVGPSVRQSTSVPCRTQELHVPVNVSLRRRS